jgi:hypothetical protein
MILVGLTGLILAWIQHRKEMKALQAEVGPMPYSIAGIMAGLIAGLGVDSVPTMPSGWKNCSKTPESNSASGKSQGGLFLAACQENGILLPWR